MPRASCERCSSRGKKKKVVNLQEVEATWQQIAQQEEEPREPRSEWHGSAREYNRKRKKTLKQSKKKERKKERRRSESMQVILDGLGENYYAFNCLFVRFPAGIEEYHHLLESENYREVHCSVTWMRIHLRIFLWIVDKWQDCNWEHEQPKSSTEKRKKRRLFKMIRATSGHLQRKRSDHGVYKWICIVFLENKLLWYEK